MDKFAPIPRFPIGRFLLAAVVAAFILGLITGCSTTPEGQRRDRLGVQVATMALIERADNPADKATRIMALSGDMRVLLDMAEVTVGDLRIALLARLAERTAAGKVSPLERLAALEFINTVADAVEKRLGAGLLTQDTRVKVNTVLTWIEDAARSYVSNPA